LAKGGHNAIPRLKLGKYLDGSKKMGLENRISGKIIFFSKWNYQPGKKIQCDLSLGFPCHPLD
jgi:hypothetical protein